MEMIPKRDAVTRLSSDKEYNSKTCLLLMLCVVWVSCLGVLFGCVVWVSVSVSLINIIYFFTCLSNLIKSI